MKPLSNRLRANPDRPSPGVHIHKGQSTVVLLTVSTENRRPWLASHSVHALLYQTWLESSKWMVGDYLLMPDHLHCFCSPYDVDYSIETWIAYWKRVFAKKHGNPAWRFQSRGWHHRLRNGENHSEKWRYIQENPVRQKLCAKPEDWAFKGRVFDLVWTKQR